MRSLPVKLNRSRRMFFFRISMGVLLLVTSIPILAQDAEWLRGWEQSQREAPANVGSVARIAPASEPGTPLYIHGRVVSGDGTTPVPGVVVFAYHTDREGLYNENDRRGWRLKGWTKTNDEGRFEFRTVRPGSYPGSRNPAHVHFTIESPTLQRRMTNDLNFADDPFVGESEKRRSAAEGRFGSVRETNTRDGIQHVAFDIRISEGGKF